MGQRRQEMLPRMTLSPRSMTLALLFVSACSPAGQGAAPGDGGRDVTTIDASGPATEGGAAGCTPYDASGIDPDVIQPGADLVVALKCRKCHGDDLSGNPGGVQTDAGLGYPPNLTPDPATGLGCWTDPQIENAFLDGVDQEGGALCPSMPRFVEAGVDAWSAYEILAYLRSMPAHYGTVPDTTCPAGAPSDAGTE
jgi:hypothetical protein